MNLIRFSAHFVKSTICFLLIALVNPSWISSLEIERFSHPHIHNYSQIILDLDSSRFQLIVGARDYLLRLSPNNFEAKADTFFWPASTAAVQQCTQLGQPPNLCHNYIQVIEKSNKHRANEIFVCGTNAFSPECTWRKADSVSTIVGQKEDGMTMSSRSPKWNTTFLMTSKGDFYYAGVLGFMGKDSVVLRNSTSPPLLLRTELQNYKWLNADTNFVASFEDANYVYFVFRESAVEYMNCGKAIYSRIGRVCKNDPGSSSGTWLSFIKARLNCSVPGQFPFYLNEIQSATYLPDEKKLYAVFSTPENSIHGSAVCAFDEYSIKRAFNSNFKYQASLNAAWDAVEDRDARDQFECNITRNDEFDKQNTQRKYQLMDGAVNAYNGKPYVFETVEQLSNIAVDIVKTKLGKTVEVFFVLTAKNKIRRYAVWPTTTKACFINELSVLSRKDDKVLTMKLFKDVQSLYLGTNYEVIRIPVSDCGIYLTKEDCLRSNDPYCGWHTKRLQCTTAPTVGKDWVQREGGSCAEEGNYMWTPWTNWQQCPQIMNHQGHLNPKCLCRWQQCSGIGCPEDSMKIEVTNCTRHGGWTDWSSWSPCSATCGTGHSIRTRSCTNPSPAFGGRKCHGPSRESNPCTVSASCAPLTTQAPNNFIVKHYVWTDYGPWSTCSASCGGGIQIRKRHCAQGECNGCQEEWQTCSMHPCPETKQSSEWSKWYLSNLTSDGLNIVEERFRVTCKAATVAGTAISLQTRREERVVDIKNGAERWSECSVSCGSGVQFMWTGDRFIKRKCKKEDICDHAFSWSPWSRCADGERVRHRVCSNPQECKRQQIVTDKQQCNDKGNGNNLDDDSIKETILTKTFDNPNNMHDGRPDAIPNDAHISKALESVSGDTKNKALHERNSTKALSVTWIVILSAIFIFGFVAGGFITYFVAKRKSAEENSRHGLSLFNNSRSKPVSNAYVSPADFKSNNCNNVSSALLAPSTPFDESSSPVLYAPLKEATIKRASTIRAKLNADQNF